MKRLKESMILSVILLCGIFASGCSSILDTDLNESNTESIEFYADSGKEYITASSSWKLDRLSEEASIQIYNAVKDVYVLVIDEEKEIFSDDMQLGDYTDVVKKNMESNVDNVSSTEIEEFSLNDNNAEYFEISGEIEKVKISYICITVESSEKFYQVIGYTPTNKFEKNKSEMKEVLNSFNVIK